MKISGKVFDMLKIVLFAALLLLLPHSVFAADDVVYTTEGGTWEQVNSTTWNMDKDGDGETDVTLVKNGDEWQYLFTVLDDKAKYFAWEEPVPDGYEVVGLGDRPNPAISSVAMSMTKYSHTPNISDDGTKNGNYGNSLNLNEVVSIPGAESLHVTIKYGGESASYDWVCMWEGSQPTYTASSNYSSSLTNKLGGGSGNVKEYDVQGDTVTFGFRSDGSGYGDGFGYYAVVSGTAPQQDAVIVNRSTETPPPATGSLSLTKQVAADTPDTEQNFRFDITLTSEDETVQKMLTGMKMYGDVSFTDGQGTVYLTHGQTVTMTGIPEGAKYSIVETPVENYEASWSGDGALAGSGDTGAFEGVVAADTTAAVTCTNTLKQESVVPRETGTLTIRKVVVNSNESVQPPEPTIAKYAVAIYGIGVDDVKDEATGNISKGGLTFGPALGENYVQSYKSHTPAGQTTAGNAHRCVHNDDWSTIIRWNKIDPFVYEECVANGCTHSVELSKSTTTTIFSDVFDSSVETGDGPSVLKYELVTGTSADKCWENLRWHPNGSGYYNGTNSGGWGTTRIRALLNGADGLTDTGVSTYSPSASSDINKSAGIYTAENCLFAAFPQNLRGAIGARAVKYDSVWNSKTEANLKITYDKLWLFSPNELGDTVVDDYYHTGYYNHPLEGKVYSKFEGSGDAYHAYSKRTPHHIEDVNNTGSTVPIWLRSCFGNQDNYAITLGVVGGVDEAIVDDIYNGVSPGFTLARQ